MKKSLEERIDECGLRWFTHMERMEMGIIVMRVYVGEFAGSSSPGRPWKKWIDTVKECLKKGGLNVRKARTMVQDRREWRGFVRGNEWSIARGMNP